MVPRILLFILATLDSYFAHAGLAGRHLGDRLGILHAHPPDVPHNLAQGFLVGELLFKLFCAARARSIRPAITSLSFR